MKYVLNLVLIIVVMSACACGPEPVWLDLAGRDVSPPLVMGVRATGEREITIEFSEKAELIEEEILFGDGENPFSVKSEGNRAVIEVEYALEAGEEYRLQARAVDSEGNSVSFSATVHGFNAHIPTILVNEVRTDGSGEKTDLIEFVILSDGNLAGLAVMTGVPGNADARYVFKAQTVKKGDFIILHSKMLGVSGEINETSSMTLATSNDTSPVAYDFFCDSPLALSKNNGCISICSTAEGDILDAVLYSNRTRVSDAKYSGFGSADFKTWAETCVGSGEWITRTSEPEPEDCVPSSLITAARSLCRSSGSLDTNTNNDWHIVPAGKTSFGTKNYDDIQP